MEVTSNSDTLKAETVKVSKLANALRTLLEIEPIKTHSALEAAGIHDLEQFLQDEKEDEDDPHAYAIWDENDWVYRCPQCMWELEGGVCEHGCALEFDVSEDEDDEDPPQSYNPDRGSQVRGDTPLDDESPAVAPSGHSYEEYENLRRRGATRLMCETFKLRFRRDVGIIAWANEDLFHEFAVPDMQPGDLWQINLGRRIQLKGDDCDGSVFMQTLLEETMVYPTDGLWWWETVEVTPSVWVTRSFARPDSGNESDVSKNAAASEKSAVLRPRAVPARDYEDTESESDHSLNGLVSFTDPRRYVTSGSDRMSSEVSEAVETSEEEDEPDSDGEEDAHGSEEEDCEEDEIEGDGEGDVLKGYRGVYEGYRPIRNSVKDGDLSSNRVSDQGSDDDWHESGDEVEEAAT